MPPTLDILSRYQAPGRVRRWVVALLALIPLGISLYLFLLATQRGAVGPAGCGGLAAFDCTHVLRSRWANWLGVPVTFGAIAAYLAVLGAWLHVGPASPPRRQRGAWTVLLVAATLIAGSALWFTAIQFFVLHRICLYCMAAHLTGLGTAGLLFWHAPVGAPRLLPDEPADPLLLAPRRALLLVLLGLVGVGGLAGGQVFFAPRQSRQVVFGGGEDTDTGPGPRRQITFLASRLRLSPHEMPVLGSPDAKALIASLNDYTCPHCRKMHEFLLAARQRYGPQLGVVILPVPLDASCNPAVEETEAEHAHGCDFARLALAVWRAGSDKFEEFDSWLYAPARPPTVAAARAQAEKLVGAAALRQALADPWVEARLRINVEAYRLTGRGVIPKILAGANLTEGRPARAEELFEWLEEKVGVIPH